MKFEIKKEIFGEFPDLVIGIVSARNVNNKGVSEEIIDFIRGKEKEIRKKFDVESLAQEPQILSWRKVYAAFGAKPKKHKCSVENLYSMILGGVELRHINKLVDIYNYISIKHLVPVGGDDLDKIEGDISLKFAKGTEIFLPLNTEEAQYPKPGEVIYCDSKETLCRRWNWRECDKSKMTERTKNAILVAEGILPATKEKIQKAISELAGLVEKYCQADVEEHILDKDNPQIIWK